MNIKDILAKVDHTLLKPTATWEEIKQILDDGIKYQCASACIPPSYVARAVEYVNNQLAICTVIGFPNGYNTTEIKKMETIDAIKNGAKEIDMVINLGWLKDRNVELVSEEIKELRETCGHHILKVIIETSDLDDDEKVLMSNIVTEAGADYIKTSTGFSSGGATFDDVKLFKENIGANVKIKAAGGIASIEDAQKFIELGADRLGTSRIVKIAKSLEL